MDNDPKPILKNTHDFVKAQKLDAQTRKFSHLSSTKFFLLKTSLKTERPTTLQLLSPNLWVWLFVLFLWVQLWWQGLKRCFCHCIRLSSYVSRSASVVVYPNFKRPSLSTFGGLGLSTANFFSAMFKENPSKYLVLLQQLCSLIGVEALLA